jgi:hypothetical protein
MKTKGLRRSPQFARLARAALAIASVSEMSVCYV